MLNNQKLHYSVINEIFINVILQKKIMLQHEKIILRPLNNNDSTELTLLLNSKKIWDNLRDYIPFPYTINDAISFINMVKDQKVVKNKMPLWEGAIHLFGSA